MTGFSFLPTFPLPSSGFILFGVILLVGLMGGCLARRSGFLPKLTGYLAVGFALGPAGLGLLGASALNEARLFVDIALGLILFELGRRLDLQWLRHDRWLLPAGLAESALSFGLIYLILDYLGIEPLQAGMAAAIGVATSPAVLLLVAREIGAEGPVARRALVLTAINNVVALLIFTALLPLMHFTFQAGWATIVLHPLYRLAGSALLGWLAYWLTLRAARLVGKQEGGQFILMVAMIVLTVGAARALNLSVLLALLAFGIAARNLDRRRDLMEVEFGYAGELFFVVLFVVTGASLQWHPAAGWAALGFVALRLAGKSTAVFAFSRVSGLSWRQAGLLGLTLMPMAGVALGMTRTVADIYPDFGAQLAAIVVSAMAILDLIGPVAVRFALKGAGETAPDKP